MVIGLILLAVAAVVAVTVAAVAYIKLSKANKKADKNFSDKKVGSAQTDCPLKDRKLLKVSWAQSKAMCGDNVSLMATATNFPDNSKCAAEITNDKTKVASIKATGKNDFELPWEIKDIVFKGSTMPDNISLHAKASACGQTKSTETPLLIERLPDQADTKLKWSLSSSPYGWDASFKFNVKKDVLNIKQVIQVKKAWLGKWISFDTTLDSRSDWGWIKKIGPTWKFWDTTATPKAWKNLPRAASNYTINNVIFIESGSDYVDRDDAANKWPESFVDPPNYDTKKQAWLDNIHDVWDEKFIFERKGCKTSDKACCAWELKFDVQWSDTAGDKLIYIIWAQEWERSNAKDWYLSENRTSVAAHECGHLLGAYDEYTGGAVDTATNKIEDDSIMGQDLTKAFARHLNELRDQVGAKINTAIGKSWTFEVKAK